MITLEQARRVMKKQISDEDLTELIEMMYEVVYNFVDATRQLPSAAKEKAR